MYYTVNNTRCRRWEACGRGKRYHLSRLKIPVVDTEKSKTNAVKAQTSDLEHKIQTLSQKTWETEKMTKK